MVFWLAFQAIAVGIVPPVALNPGFGISYGDYPSAALTKGDVGIVSVLLKIDGNGLVKDCIVTESSGSRALDSGTCALLRRKARFTPASEKGMAIDGDFRTALSWGVDGRQPRATLDATLPVVVMPEGYNGPVNLHVEFDTTGHVADCVVVKTSGSASADAVACRTLREQWTLKPPVSGSGEPARAVRFAHIGFIASSGPKH